MLEVYYDLLRRFGKDSVADFLADVENSSLFIVSEITDDVFKEAGRLKTTYKISLADSIALAEAFVRNAALVTSDNHEFDDIERNEQIVFQWIR